MKGKLNLQKNESYRVRVVWKGKCDFLDLCSKMDGIQTYLLKT